MAWILAGITGAVLAAKALWKRLTHEDPVVGLMASRKIKLGTNLLIVGAQAVGYAAELLAGTRSTLPSTTSTTTNTETRTSPSGVTLPGGAAFGSRTAATMADA